MYIVYKINVFLVFHVEHYYNRIKNFCVLVYKYIGEGMQKIILYTFT